MGGTGTILRHPGVGQDAISRCFALLTPGTLNRGARFLDIRVCWDTKSNLYRTLHFILGSPTEEILRNISEFLTDYHEEIVILQWGAFDGFAVR